ncbi:MAG: hypothetical protein ACR2RA_19160 [Geminicoccaceae bacterium]
MGSPGGGVGGSSSSGGPGGTGGNDNDGGGPSGSGGNDNDHGGPSGSDRDSSNDRDKTSRADTKSDKNEDSGQRGMTGSERTATSFDDAMSAAGPPSGLSDPADTDTDRSDDDSARASAQDNHPANEFSGLGASGGPTDDGLSGDGSRNSHRGYGPDDSVAGGIDDGVNAGLGAADANHPANEFSGLGPSGGPIDNSLAGGIDDGVNAGLNQTTQDPDTAPSGYGGGATADDGFADGPPDHQFSGSVNTVAAAAAGMLNIEAAYVDHRGRNNAADIATRGNAGRFTDVPGHADRASYADDLRGGKISAAGALDAAPFGPNAKTTQALSNAARTAGNLGRVAGPIGTIAGPAAEIAEGVMNAEEGDKVQAGLASAAATTDDIGAGGLGALVGGGIGTFLGGPGLGTGIGAAIGGGLTSYFYDDSAADKAADSFIKDQVSGDHRKDGVDQTDDFGPMP